jgi:DNA-3-methyladenine glycosylase I
LFEVLIREGAQAGLSWSAVLKKREHYRLVFNSFNSKHIALYDDQKVAELLADPGIIRNRAKVPAQNLNNDQLAKPRRLPKAIRTNIG